MRGTQWTAWRRRPAAWIVLLAAVAVALAVLAGREADRAQRTADVLMKDYAASIADKFVDTLARRHGGALGLPGFEPARGSAAPFVALRAFAEGDRGGSPLPAPAAPEVVYLFVYDVEAGDLRFSGRAPEADERERLRATLDRFRPDCGPGQLVPFAQFRKGEAARGPDWAGLTSTDAKGRPLRFWGLRVDEQRATDGFIVPLLTADHDCNCLRDLLPAGLSSVSDPRKVASFIVRDGAGRVRFRSSDASAGAIGARRPLASPPSFTGWTVEVAIDPTAVRPLLPYAGRGTPGLLVSFLGLATILAASLAIRSARHDAELVRLRQDFVANVSHELKTPVARIRLFNELLTGGKQPDAERRKHYERVIDRECRRLTFLVDNVLDFARLERGRGAGEHDAVDLRQMVQETLETFRGGGEEARCTVEASLEPVPPVRGDAPALGQVLMNLLDNAFKYSPEGGRVEVTLRADGRFVRLAVHDEGCGIAPEHHGRIFEDFYRVERGDAQKVAGSGLGLALVRRTVEAHGGRVSVESRVGEGSTFTVLLPFAEPGGAPVPVPATGSRGA